MFLRGSIIFEAMKYLYTTLYIILAVVAVLNIHKLSPTDMAGPGLDIVVYFLAVLMGVVLVAKSIMKVVNRNRTSYILFAINGIGLLIVTIAVYYIWTKKN